MSKEQSVKPEKRIMEVATNLERMIPKFCSTMDVALQDNKKNVILTMLFAEKSEDREFSSVIERVVIDIDHAASLNRVLTRMLEDIGYGAENN